MNGAPLSFGENVAQRRAGLAISRDELASRAGISLSMLAKIERDEVNPTIAIAGKLAKALNTTISSLLDERPEPRHYCGNIHQYIDSLKLADEQFESVLARRQELDPDFRATYNRTYIYDRNCRFLFVSIAGARMAGMAPGDLVGKHWRELGFPAEVMEKVELNIKSVFSSGSPLTAETIFPAIDGLDYIDYRLKPFIDERGSIAAVVSTTRDITNSRLVELELMKNAGGIGRLAGEDVWGMSVNPLNFLAIYANSLDGILLTTPDGKVLDANPAACRMFGMSREELLNIGRGVADPTDSRLQRALEEQKKNGAALAAIRFIRKDGSKFVGEVSSNLFQTSTGQIYSSMVIRDTTSRPANN